MTEEVLDEVTPTVVPFTMPDTKKRDLELFHAWKAEPSRANSSALIKQLSPIIYSEVRRVSGTLPEAALSGEAKKWAYRAIQTYDPSKGVALSTHVSNYLPKVRRLNYKYQNAARLPENLHLQFTEFHNAVSHLENTLNREPTDKEIAKHLKWSEPQVIKYRGSLYEDLTESATQRPNETSQFNSNVFLMDHIMDKLDTQETAILKGVNAVPPISAQQLADQLGINISRLNYLKSKLKDKILKIKEEIRMY